MLIFCNRIGGYNLLGIDLRLGENEVDAERWADVAAKLPPAWLDALLTPQGSKPPDLVIEQDKGPLMAAKEKIALIERAGHIEDLAQYEAGETRKTVLLAIERRMRALIEAENIEGPT